MYTSLLPIFCFGQPNGELLGSNDPTDQGELVGHYKVIGHSDFGERIKVTLLNGTIVKAYRRGVNGNICEF